ncbi:NUDIX domain-containing protein [Arthrobacter cheniae]|uniref:NUDIX domain-containing protein n=1 Tax=Arthrobacter cheniae TaxID=1258888 RepID=A0A3A5M2X2_9MICC|nr:NUDIX domain-containing protein [Arthrobacter cheniae]RJT77295.1 NUDIX domain-containing protein [Arthrobacter cheniae]
MITVTALCLLDEANRLLLVRKRGTSMFMQPGGKPEPGETAAQTGVRELSEELSLTVPAEELTLIGTWEGPAANEADTLLIATVFLCPLTAEPRPAAEIEELDWLDLGQASGRHDLAPLLTDYVIPRLRDRRDARA